LKGLRKKANIQKLIKQQSKQNTTNNRQLGWGSYKTIREGGNKAYQGHRSWGEAKKGKQKASYTGSKTKLPERRYQRKKKSQKKKIFGK